MITIGLFCFDAAAKDVAEDKKLKVFILAGQSNMVGHSNAHTMATLFNADGPRDLTLIDLVFGKDANLSKKRFDETLALAKQLNELTGGSGDKKIEAMKDADQKAAAEAKAAPMKAALEAYQKEVVEASVVSDRVYINSIADKNRRFGKLAVGFGGSQAKIGPEYAFGLSIAEKIDGPILLIKTSWGGKSLNYDFRPPSAGPYTPTGKEKGNPEDVKKNAGLYYRMMNEQVRQVLDNLEENHPAYDSAVGYEIAGFVWFQGFNDQFNDHFRANYKDNMVAFIKDIRSEYKTPKMPFVIGVLGTARAKSKEAVDENEVSIAQREAAAVPEFKGNVVAVESYTEYALDSLEVFNAGWKPNYYLWNLVGSDRPYHYLGSGKFFVRLGDAFATAMDEMIKKQ